MRSFLAQFGLRLIAFAMAALPCFAGEVAVLKNGFTIQHERREVVGDLTRLYVSADGASYVDIRTDDIDHYEEAPPEIAPASSRTNKGISGVPHAQQSADLNDVVNQAGGRYRLDPDLINSVIKAESGFNVRAVSPKGAQGLMQLMPGTASQLGVPNSFDPEANVDGGAKYLRELLERYNFDLVKALAAYNAGPQRVEQYGGVPPYRETQAYIARIVKDFNRKKIAQGVAAPPQKTAVTKSGKSKSSTTTAKNHVAKSVAQAKAPGTPSE